EEHVALAVGHSARAHQVFRFRAGWIPGFAAVIRALDDLAKPPARLRRVNAIRIRGRSFQMVNLPAREVRAVDLPVFARAIRREDERALLRADEDSNFAHGFSYLVLVFVFVDLV